MIYPTATGKAGEIIRLNTLESTMVQGRLKCGGAGRSSAAVAQGICLTNC